MWSKHRGLCTDRLLCISICCVFKMQHKTVDIESKSIIPIGKTDLISTSDLVNWLQYRNVYLCNLCGFPIVKVLSDTWLPVQVVWEQETSCCSGTCNTVPQIWSGFTITYNNVFVPNVVIPNISDKCYHIIQGSINHSSTYETVV